jgi:glycosyltransferase involved in cell wall biosynthesis
VVISMNDVDLASDATPRNGKREGANGLGVLAVIPARNEAPTIATIVSGVVSQLPVLVIDDGSQEETADLAREAGATVISHDTNRGKGAALLTGFAWAMAEGYDAVVTLDADGQHAPEDLAGMINAYLAGAGDLIIGERTFSVMPFPRWLSQPIGSWLLTRALGVKVTDCQSGFRVLSRRLIEKMRLRATGYEMEVEMIWEAVRLRLPIGWVPIQTIYLPGRKSGFHPLKDTFRFLRMTWQIWRARRSQQGAPVVPQVEEDEACLGQRTIS